MIAVHEINTDLLTQGMRPRIYVVQDDIYTREVHVNLYAGGKSWNPSGATAAVGYVKPDNTIGLYDTLPDGSPAIKIAGNTVTVILAAQMTTVPGTVEAAVTLADAAGNQISTFAFDVIVARNPASGAIKSEDYFNFVHPMLQSVIDTAIRAATDANTAASRANAASDVAYAANDKADQLRSDVTALQTAQELTSTAIGAVRDDISELRTAQAETMAAFSGTDRRLNYLWKKNVGILYDTEMVTGSGSVVPVPSGAMAVACLNRIGGMSRKGKNLLNPTLVTTTKNGITCTKNADGTYTVNGTASESTYLELISNFPFDAGKQYRLTGCPSGGASGIYQLMLQDTSDSKTWLFLAGDTGKGVTFQVNAPSNILRIAVYKNATLDNLVFKPMITADLSADYDDFEPYADHLIHAGVDGVTTRNRSGAAIEEKPIPQAIRDACPDYGIGVNANCYNYIDLVEKTYHHRVSRIDMGKLNYSNVSGAKTACFRASSTVPDMVKLSSAATNPNFLTNRYTTSNAMTIYQTDIDMVIGLQYDNGTSTGNKIWIRDLSCADADTLEKTLSGVMLCYERAKEEIINLSAVWGDFDQRIAVEAGGSLQLHYPEKDSGYEVAVPSRMEIMVNLSEVEA